MTRDCPDLGELNRLLEGGLSAEAEQLLTAHLDQCAECRLRLERVAVGDRTLSDVARHLRGSGELTDALKRVIEKCASDPMIVLREPGLRLRSGLGPDLDDEQFDTGLRHLRQPANDRPRPDCDSAGMNTVLFSPGPGDRLGSYEILEEIGRGGMGVVWKGFDRETDRLVAIKVLDSQVLADPTARQRFLREARAVAAVKHCNVVAMYGVEESPVPYLVMEFVDGPSLRTHLAKKGPLDLPTVLKIGLQIANALEASHAQGVTHRDIKPANIVLDMATGRVKLTDYGLAHIEGESRLTLTGFVSGTPAYMSPEQATGESVDHRSDLFSLGSVLYAMSTGRSPFDDEQTLAALDRVCRTEPILPQTLNPEVPASLSDLIQWLHAKQPDDRPASAAEVARLLEQQLEQLIRPKGPGEPAGVADPLIRAVPDEAEQQPCEQVDAAQRNESVMTEEQFPSPSKPISQAQSSFPSQPAQSTVSAGLMRRSAVVAGAIACVLALLSWLGAFRSDARQHSPAERQPAEAKGGGDK